MTNTPWGPPDLEDIIRRQQETKGRKDPTLFTNISRIVLGVGMAIFGAAMLVSINIVQQNLERAEKVIERGVAAMDHLPAATERMEKLVQRIDGSVSSGIKQLKEAVPAVPEGWINGIRNGLNKEPTK